MATNQALIHYALDQQEPPVMACDTPAKGAIYSTEPREVTCPRCVYSNFFPLSQALDEEDRPLIAPPFGTHIVTGHDVLMKAAALIGDDIGAEYDRAIIDLTSDLIGAGPDDSLLMERILRSLAEGK